MRRLDALYPRYGFSSHVGYITPGHTRAVVTHGPCPQHRRSFQARAYAEVRRGVNRGERLRRGTTGSADTGSSARTSAPAGYEVDLIARRGRRLVFVEVKERARPSYGGAVGAVNREKRRRVRRAAASWLQAHPESAGLEIRFEVAAVTGRSRRAARLRGGLTPGGNDGNARSVRIRTRPEPGGTIPQRARSSERATATAEAPGAQAASSEVAGETSG